MSFRVKNHPLAAGTPLTPLLDDFIYRADVLIILTETKSSAEVLSHRAEVTYARAIRFVVQ